MMIILIFMTASSPPVQNHAWGLGVGPDYATYLLYQNEEEGKGLWQFGAQVEARDIVSNVGIKVHGSRVKYQSGDYAWEYTPISCCTSFNVLPFLPCDRLRLTLETGMGVYFWRGLLNDEVMILPGGEASERDIGFVIGTTLELVPIKGFALQSFARYNYLASANIYKYGFADTDERLLEIGVGIRAVRYFGRSR